ncbi:ATP synthesis coupled proton transport [Dermatophagoides farinae]|uniref:ATP synthesis coupled proton transport n=1 Tax=Dermatophagoides farinae TaxID=6954 RepID=A0A922ICL9_DERFA|nr:atp synthase-coupling factor 6 [Dermatophagoides farinae]KAH9529567.1 ATP synthesis coupled proton transport [Dermatophagoides farinae]
MLVLRRLQITFSPNIICRSFASASPATDPIQKLFVDKIKEYSNKAKSAPGGLVDSSPEVVKKLKEDMERVANAYGIKDEANIANLGLKFDETTKIDPINMK